mmetsp:Transcript_61220/g.155502  ORF Transcript_61220/g.155502 Transcript_61220/m.155502 type:complete len:219 (+) Transcript_61220:474-1130(+)
MRAGSPRDPEKMTACNRPGRGHRSCRSARSCPQCTCPNNLRLGSCPPPAGPARAPNSLTSPHPAPARGRPPVSGAAAAEAAAVPAPAQDVAGPTIVKAVVETAAAAAAEVAAVGSERPGATASPPAAPRVLVLPRLAVPASAALQPAPAPPAHIHGGSSRKRAHACTPVGLTGNHSCSKRCQARTKGNFQMSPTHHICPNNLLPCAPTQATRTRGGCS